MENIIREIINSGFSLEEKRYEKPEETIQFRIIKFVKKIEPDWYFYQVHEKYQFGKGESTFYLLLNEISKEYAPLFPYAPYGMESKANTENDIKNMLFEYEYKIINEIKKSGIPLRKIIHDIRNKCHFIKAFKMTLKYKGWTKYLEVLHLETKTKDVVIKESIKYYERKKIGCLGKRDKIQKQIDTIDEKLKKLKGGKIV